MRRRDLLHGGVATALVLTGTSRAADAPVAPVDGPFDAGTVRRLAQTLAMQPYVKPSTSLPPAIDQITFDEYRGIRFIPERALWRGAGLPFQVQFFPLGFLYRTGVDVFEVADGVAHRVAYDPDMFGYAKPSLRVTDNIGFAGFRVHAPINRADYFDEVCVFLGASYFRAVAKGQVYGLSARGLAIGTGSSRGEEFARFRSFWLERPREGVNAIVINALLDSVSVTGAYRFTVRPGDTTVFDVESVLYPRTDITEGGIGVNTGMFYFDANDRRGIDDFRPAAHDSEGLSMWGGRGDQVWRPLTNPRDLQISVFEDANVHGFGLMQRKRAFADYQDLEVHYEKRPSLWVEPIGDWGQGAVQLVEIPTPNEINDNIVAFWRPKDKLAAHGEYPFTYRMHWGWDNPNPTKLARIAQTRDGASHDGKGRLFVIDFTGGSLKALPPEARPHADVGASAGNLDNVVVQPNPEIDGWRISFEMNPGSEKLIELHCILMNDATRLSEIWLYRWTA